MTSKFDCSDALMYDRNLKAASFTAVLTLQLIAPDQPPNDANGAWLMPFTAFLQVVASHGTSLPVLRSRTIFEPDRMTAPTLSLTFEVVGTIGGVTMSTLSMVW